MVGFQSIVVIENEDEKKRAFAVALTKNPSNPFLAAMAVESDTGKALYISQTWIGDPDVLAYQANIFDGEKPDDSHLWDKIQLLEKIAERALIADDEQAHKYFKLYAEIRQYIEKPQTTISNTNVITNKVMIVKDHGTNEDWRKKAAAQQDGLINASSRTIN